MTMTVIVVISNPNPSKSSSAATKETQGAVSRTYQTKLELLDAIAAMIPDEGQLGDLLLMTTNMNHHLQSEGSNVDVANTIRAALENTGNERRIRVPVRRKTRSLGKLSRRNSSTTPSSLCAGSVSTSLVCLEGHEIEIPRRINSSDEGNDVSSLGSDDSSFEKDAALARAVSSFGGNSEDKWSTGDSPKSKDKSFAREITRQNSAKAPSCPSRIPSPPRRNKSWHPKSESPASPGGGGGGGGGSSSANDTQRRPSHQIYHRQSSDGTDTVPAPPRRTSSPTSKQPESLPKEDANNHNKKTAPPPSESWPLPIQSSPTMVVDLD